MFCTSSHPQSPSYVLPKSLNRANPFSTIYKQLLYYCLRIFWMLFQIRFPLLLLGWLLVKITGVGPMLYGGGLNGPSDPHADFPRCNCRGDLTYSAAPLMRNGAIERKRCSLHWGEASWLGLRARQASSWWNIAPQTTSMGLGGGSIHYKRWNYIEIVARTQENMEGDRAKCWSTKSISFPTRLAPPPWHHPGTRLMISWHPVNVVVGNPPIWQNLPHRSYHWQHSGDRSHCNPRSLDGNWAVLSELTQLQFSGRSSIKEGRAAEELEHIAS